MGCQDSPGELSNHPDFIREPAMPTVAKFAFGFLVVSMAACGGCAALEDNSGEDLMLNETFGPDPAPRPDRTISEQDCQKPIEIDGGNLRCK